MPSPLHIALYFSGLAGGGAQRRMLSLAQGFVRRGHDVDVVVAGADGPFSEAVPDAARVVDVCGPLARIAGVRRRRPLRVLATVMDLARYLETERPDVVLSSSNPANVTALLARRLSRASVPTVLRVNVHLTAATEVRGRTSALALRTALGIAYRRADRVVAVSEEVARDLRTNFRIDARRVSAIVNPIDVASIREGARAALEHEWLRPGNPPLLLAVGKLSRQKDFPTLLRALARVRRDCGANLVILGEGAERARLESLVAELGLSDAVAMPGFERNPYAWMAAASVFVLSSSWEGSSNVLAEALACGCPVVSTDCPGGPRDLLEGGRLGPLVETGNPDALAAGILEALAGSTERVRRQARAEQFDIDAATDRYLAVLRDAVREAAERADAAPRAELA